VKKLAAYSIIASVTLMTGCASIVNDQAQTINVSASNGKEIKGTVDGAEFTTPGVVSVKRQNSPKIVAVSTAGCDKETVVPNTVDPWFFGNILIGGLLGSTTDYSTEKMWKYSDNVVVSCGQ
jgi:hypothetical protein